jgi:lipopolysaccharide export system protein LptC
MAVTSNEDFAPDKAAGQRLALHRHLAVRNRLVGLLRLGLPALGVVAFLGIAGQIFIASLVPQFNLGQIHFAGDTVTVDTPSYSGVTADGDVYRITAEGAATTLTSLDVIDLKSATLELTQPDGRKLTARTDAASFATIGRVLRVPGVAQVFDNRGNKGTFADLLVDLPSQHLRASGQVRLTLANGTRIESNGLDYSPKSGVWDFGRATLTVADPTLMGSD